MKKLKFNTTPVNKKLEVNGIVFDVLMNDMEVIEHAKTVNARISELQGKLNEINEDTQESTEQDNTESLEVLDFLNNSVNGMLGEGAVLKITNGKIISIAQNLELYHMIAHAIIEIYAKDIKQKYS